MAASQAIHFLTYWKKQLISLQNFPDFKEKGEKQNKTLKVQRLISLWNGSSRRN